MHWAQLRFNHVDAAHERFDEDLRFGRVVDADGVGFAVEDDGRVFAFGDEDGLVEGDF